MGSVADEIRAFGTAVVHAFVLAETETRLSIITFSGSATLELGLSTNQDAALEVVAQYEPNGWTNIAAAIELANTTLATEGRGQGVPGAAFLLTDGVTSSNYGTDKDAILAAYRLKSEGYTLFAMGFAGASEQTLEAMSSSPTSQYAYLGTSVEDIAEASSQLCSIIASPRSPPMPPPPSPLPSSPIYSPKSPPPPASPLFVISCYEVV